MANKRNLLKLLRNVRRIKLKKYTMLKEKMDLFKSLKSVNLKIKNKPS